MQSETPVVAGLEPFEIKIGGAEANQPQYETLHALSAPDGRVMSRWHLSDEEREAVANGADILVTLWTAGQPYTPTRLEIAGPDLGAEYFKKLLFLEDSLELRMLAEDMMNAQKAFEERQKVFSQKANQVHEKICGRCPSNQNQEPK